MLILPKLRIWIQIGKMPEKMNSNQFPKAFQIEDQQLFEIKIK